MKINEFNATKERVISFDFLRVVAILLVILLHTVSGIVGSGNTSSINFIVANILNGISRIGVPIFFMISGALMLDENKNVSIKSIICKNVKNIVVLLVFWSLFYAVLYEIVVPLLITKEGVSFNAFILSLLNGATHLWFLFVLIGLYLITPMLRMFINKKNIKLAVYFVVLASVFCLLPKTLDFILSIFGVGAMIELYLSKFDITFVLGCSMYYVLGWLIVNLEISKKFRIIFDLMGLLSLIYMIISVQLVSTKGNYVGEIVYNDLTINVCLYAISIFIFFWNRYKDRQFTKHKKIIVALSNMTFGVYVIHVAVLYFVGHYFIGASVFIRVPICFLVATFTSFGLSYILSKIPIIKVLVKG